MRNISHRLQIAHVEAFALRFPYEQPIADARSVITHKATVFVRVETRTGVCGWGEAAAFGDVSSEVAGIVNSRLSKLVIGRNASPREIIRILTSSTAHFGQKGLVLSAISGLEIALWDTLARVADLPLCHLLGASSRPVSLYAGTGYYAPDSTRVRDLAKLEADLHKIIRRDCFGGAKIKIGRHGVADDIERVRIAREMLGPEAVLIADANNAYSFHEALEFARGAETYGLKFLEEPIEFGQPKASALLRGQSPVPIAGYELETSRFGLLPYVECGSVDFIQPDCTWSGGILECLEIATAAERAGINVSPHNFASPIATAANYHFLCATTGSLLEVDGTDTPLEGIIEFDEDGRRIEGGFLSLLGPGLGLVPNLECVRALAKGISSRVNAPALAS